ncbi:putative copper/silver efflux system, membrane fusion protein CusB [Arcobacter venerupis]|uniref:Copper/silver efflux system, membrane fusion protein CusB n=1 Tax=Arcobacter venerupis TaxID=1054033 RepID=A0AAE7B8G8_9BACT|nr:efflux RND transporter periplasmic adaptor subunit [Arcobacter venerupis]QKF65719.1 putative copper/silver efflux system, membrane fusion protein CusB [Arcobacter venerupis]RWS50230.1 cation transporter [Arcobacter venerupis]
MIKNLVIFTLLLSAGLQAQIIDAKQLFNKTTTKVKKEEISINKSFYGLTKIDESSLTDIVSRFDGFITKLNANNKYMTIKKGEPLYSIYSQDILSIQNELEIAKGLNANIYKSTLSKLDNLDISKAEQQRIKDGKVNSNGITVSSPINGLLIEKSINQTSAVNKGKLLLQLASLEKIWFIASVYQSDLEYVKKQKDAVISIDGIDEKISSKVDFIYPIFDEKTKTVDVRFVLDNKDLKLIPSMFGKADISVNKDVMLTLPKTAVLKKANDFYVFKPLENGEFEPKKIKAKRISSNKYEILSGLEEDDEVINNALFLLDSDAVTNSLYQSDDEDW